ncbi:helix-turn-helix transcriptional regulator [Ramlibacter sp. AW1]|uniref:Helix-turn-helix transcriptional regulator n=1 Tax=Ramlibacter aurantiacus TaxID=2801330 RepID=A0A936ZLG2_9BURK|nr:helix-turn-helix transcriptional regulator [Ramlibacter aurantiacus]MBL0423057.1 helix-turn-helix transcriptional regulator [Ramlibacter aurantiacus]
MNQAQEQAAHEAIDRLYEAVADESRWPDALGAIATAFDSPRVAILRQPPRMDGLIELRALNHDPDAQRRYNEYYWALDPSHRLTRQAAVGSWLDRPELFDPATTPEPEYMDFAIRNGIRHVAGGKVHADGTSVTLLGVQRPGDHRPFDQASAELFRRLSSHVGRAAALSAELRASQINGVLSLAALDRLDAPVFAINHRGKLLMANAAAERALRSQEPFTLHHGHLSSRDVGTVERFAAAAGASMGGSGCAFSVRTPAGFWLIRVVPLPGFAGASLVYANRANNESVPAQTLAQLFGFSPAESAVALMLIDGLSAKEIAFSRAVSINTVRAQIREILHKTGVTRQTDLVKMLLAIPRVDTRGRDE